MRKVPALLATVVLFLFLMPFAGIRAQTNGDEYTREVKLATGFMKEGRYDEALDALDKAFKAKPDNHALELMGYIFLAQGKSTEAMDVFDHVLSGGGTISLGLQHMHGLAGSCRGTLVISASKIRWESTNQKENFETTPGDVQGFTTSELVNSNGDGSVSSFLQFRASKKNWKFIYLLYGPSGKYVVAQNLWFSVVYVDPDLGNDRKANATIGELLKSVVSIKLDAPSEPEKIASTNAPAPVTSTNSPNAPAPAAASTELTEGQTTDQVQKLLGKPLDVTTVKETVVYTYPTVKVYFERGKLVNVEERKQ